MATGTDALREYQRKLEAGEVERTATKTPWEKLRENPTLKRRIVAFCHNCMGWEEGGERPDGIMADIRGSSRAGFSGEKVASFGRVWRLLPSYKATWPPKSS